MNNEPTALQRLLNEQKGKTVYRNSEAFILQVFWEAPNIDAAHRLLDALNKCAIATQRDTPCVPTYFFRISNNDTDLYGDAPKLVRDHLQLAGAIKKLQVGVSRSAIIADLTKRGIDPLFLDLDLSAELPKSLQGQKPVALEFTELYLDERAFMEHAGSRDYLDAYGTVMTPGLCNRVHTTLRFGTPSQSMIDKILEPILKESVVDTTKDSKIWNIPKQVNQPFLVSIDYSKSDLENYCFSEYYQSCCIWSIRFAHPVRNGITRVMTVFPSELDDLDAIFSEISKMNPIRGEIHTTESGVCNIKQRLEAAGLGSKIALNATRAVGYVAHEKAAELKSE